jgi:hypothetical protein
MPSFRQAGSACQPPKEVASLSPVVNDPRTLRGPPRENSRGALHRFTPYYSLAALAADPRRLALSPPARTLLGVCLWRAGPEGRGEDCRPGEGMFVRRLGGLVADTRLGRSTVKRAAAELRALGLLRWTIVRAGQKMPALSNAPGGARLAAAVCVFYLAADPLRGLLGLGTRIARRVQIEPVDGSKPFRPDPPKPAEIGTRCGKIDTEIASGSLWLTVNKQTTEPQCNSALPPSGGGGLDSDSESPTGGLVAHWWQLVGRKRLGGSAPSPRIRLQLERAVSNALADGYGEDDLRAVIAARADRRIGGPAWDFCEHPDHHPERPIWGAGIFGGPLDHLLAAARHHQARPPRPVEAPPRGDPSEGQATPPVDPAEALRLAAQLRQMGISVELPAPSVVRRTGPRPV